MDRKKYDHHIAKEHLQRAAELMSQAQEAIQIAVVMLKSEASNNDIAPSAQHHWAEVANTVEPVHDSLDEPISICFQAGRF